MLKSLINAFWPSECLFCQHPADRKKMICDFCHAQLPWNHNPCLLCARPLGNTQLKICHPCKLEPPHFHHTIAPLLYKKPLDKMVSQLKFHSQLIYAHIMGTLLADYIRNNLDQKDYPDVLIPVPLHIKRLQHRGFNQALEVTKVVNKKLLIPIDYHSCIRSKNTLAQSSLDKELRISNMRRAFSFRNLANYQSVAIIDDVITTGNTINSIANVLKQQGIIQISAWCCTRAIASH